MISFGKMVRDNARFSLLLAGWFGGLVVEKW